MKRVRIAELEADLSALLQRVEGGESLEVIHRERPIAHIVPVTKQCDTVVVIPSARSFAELRTRRYRPARWNVSSLGLLMEERAGG